MRRATAEDRSTGAWSVSSVPVPVLSRLRITLSTVSTFAPALALGCSLIVAFALYAPALDNAFVFDDALDLTRVEGRSYLSLLTSSEGYSYYRPLPFLIWKLSRDVLGYYDHTLLHALPIIAHAVSGWLLFLLVRRLGFGLWATVPALLFLTYPFSYQDVMITGVAFHPLVTMWLLACLNFYDLGRRAFARRSLALHSAALATALPALWTHESGVVVLPLIIGLEAIHLWRVGSRRPSPWVLAHVVATVAFVLTWFTVEKAPVRDTATAADLRPKGLFFLQGFTYPFSAQIRPVEEWLGVAPGLMEVGLLALLLVPGAVVLAAWQRGERRVRLLTALAPVGAGLLVALAAVAPPMLRLSWEYVVDAPRLLYLVGLGAAVFWGLLPALEFRRGWMTAGWRVLTLSFLALVVIQSWVFIERRNEMFLASTRAVEALTSAGAQHDGGRLLVVNMPSWLALDAYEYPYGHLGAQAVPTYVGLDRAIYVNSSRLPVLETKSIEFFPAVSAGRYTFGPHGAPASPQAIDQHLRDGYNVLRIGRSGDGFTAREGGRLLPGAADPGANAVAVDGGNVAIDAVRAASIEDCVAVYLSWHVEQRPANADRTIVELRSAEGDIVRSYEGASLLGLSSPGQWRAGDRIDDVVWFEPVRSGRYEVWAGISAGSVDASKDDEVRLVGRIDIR